MSQCSPIFEHLDRLFASPIKLTRTVYSLISCLLAHTYRMDIVQRKLAQKNMKE